jgi:hypothetical protein
LFSGSYHKEKKEEKKMNTKSYVKVYSTNGRLQAALIETSLNLAGIPAILVNSKNGSYMDICVPTEHSFDAQNILNPDASYREICVLPELM